MHLSIIFHNIKAPTPLNFPPLQPVNLHSPVRKNKALNIAIVHASTINTHIFINFPRPPIEGFDAS